MKAICISGSVSVLDRDGMAFFGIFGSAFFLFEQEAFAIGSRRRICERFGAGCAHEVVVDAACVRGGVLPRAVAREIESV